MRIEDELQSRFKDEYHKLAVNIHLTSARIGESFMNEIKKRDLTNTQYNVLRILRGQNGNAVSIGLIKNRMIERNSDVSRIIDRLKKKELIDCCDNKEDRRQRDVRISESGLELLAEIDKFEHLIAEEFEHLTEDEVDWLNTLLDKARSKP